MTKEKKQKIEFSKKIFYIVITFTVIVIAYSMALMWKTNDTSALAYLIPAVFGLASLTIGFYYNKAKLENKIKLYKKYGISIDKETVDDLSENDSTVEN